MSNRIISRADNGNNIKGPNELRSRAHAEEPIKRTTGCPASASIFHFS